jgi:xanthine phosphoribosyltransferase
MKSILVTIEEFQDLSYRLLEEIRASGKKYRSVICPLRGGFYLSYFISRHLGIPLEYIQISSYDKTERKDFTVGIRSDLGEDLFLLCDDIYDSGRTVRMIHSLYPHIVLDTACLVTKVRDAPTYYGREVAPENWVNFFWEIL